MSKKRVLFLFKGKGKTDLKSKYFEHSAEIDLSMPEVNKKFFDNMWKHIVHIK